MGDKIGQPRYYVEEMLGRSGLELKKELEDGDKTICYYGDPLDEEGYWEYIYDSNEMLVSYRELHEVLEKLVLEDVQEDLDELVTIGENRSMVEEVIAKYMFFEPVENEVSTEAGVAQKYGMKDKNGYKPFIIVYYDQSGKVIDRKLVDQ